MTAEDREVLREVWGGRVPACFKLASWGSPDDGAVAAVTDSAVASADPYYLMLPRLSYLTLVTEKIRKHFSSKMLLPSVPGGSEGDSEMWFSDGSSGSPLKWHLPVGVLFDQLTIQNQDSAEETAEADDSCLGHLPWNINVHFGNFPKEQLIKFDSRELMESHFMSCIKEADQIKHGGRVISAMQKKDHNQLWQGLQNDKFDQFWAVNRRLMDNKTGLTHAASDPSTGTDRNTFKHIPVRLYRCAAAVATAGEAPLSLSDQSPPMHQKLVKPVVQLHLAVADSVSDDPSGEGGESGRDASSQETQHTRLATLKDLVAEMVPGRPCEEVKVVTQGISPEWDTPLQWMSEHLSYPDNFLHICVR